MKKYNFKYIDLFAGCGGLSLGLLNAGWKGLFAVEKSPDAFKTLHYNLINKKEHFAWPEWLPIENYNIDHLLKKFRKELIQLKNGVDLVAGGPPCQGFSLAGRRNEDDSRNRLIDSYLEFIEIVRPSCIFFENVKGFTLSFKNNAELGKNYSEYVIKRLQNIGYYVHGQLLDFSKFGVPQKRTRFILIGIIKTTHQSEALPKYFFDLLHSKKEDILFQKCLKMSTNLEDAISDLLEAHGTTRCPDSKNFRSGLYSIAKTPYQKFLRGEKRVGTVPDSHRLVNHSDKIKARFQYAIENDLGPAEYRAHFKLSKSGTKKVSKDQPTPTLTTLPDDYIHYQEPRVFTVREFARIQSFPDWFEFKGEYTTGGKARVKQTPRYTQAGNAIPPLFAEIAGITLKELLNV
ncbi:MAG: DNA cytosine methyltransferase [Candidatus Electrothrix sp. LOE1_4_5]|nr:DNA cytosine methyltransferase [Candidatus Electrothrix gigas]MCI5188702.1 DNA cytosine methyltransferase [Candidatus Electrothrix gigas]